MNNKNRKINPNSEMYKAILQLKDTDECFRFSRICVPFPNSMPWNSGSKWLACWTRA